MWYYIDTSTTESCVVDDLRRLGTSEQSTRTTAAGVSGDLSRTLSELLHMRRVLLLLCTHYCSY